MIEYSALLTKNTGGWLEEALYQIQTISSLPYFWPGLVVAVVAIFFAGRLFLK